MPPFAQLFKVGALNPKTFAQVFKGQSSMTKNCILVLMACTSKECETANEHWSCNTLASLSQNWQTAALVLGQEGGAVEEA